MSTYLLETERQKSASIYRRSCQVIPGGVNSPVRSFPGLNETPLVAVAGKKDMIVDADGREYIDYCNSWGALIHGHAHPNIVNAACKRLTQGSTFGITTPIEADFAEFLVSQLPWIEKIRFVSSGTEATMTAIRMARGYTGKNGIVKFAGNYHGHSDPFLVQAGSGVSLLNTTSSSKGIPEGAIKNTYCLPYNDIEACQHFLRAHGSEIAAVIIEPIAANMGLIEASQEFITMLREETSQAESLLIFDEVIDGFRVAFGGAAEYFGIRPDLACYGKIIGGGLPAAAVGGREEIMDMLAPLGPVYQAGTLSGNPVAMEAGYQSVKLCTAPNFYKILEEKTNLITDPIRNLIASESLNLCLHQVGSLFTLFFGSREIHNFADAKRCDISRFNRFFALLFQKGIYLAPSQFEANFVSMAHTEEHLLYTRECILEAIEFFKKASLL